MRSITSGNRADDANMLNTSKREREKSSFYIQIWQLAFIYMYMNKLLSLYIKHMNGIYMNFKRNFQCMHTCIFN